MRYIFESFVQKGSPSYSYGENQVILDPKLAFLNYFARRKSIWLECSAQARSVTLEDGVKTLNDMIKTKH